MRKGIHPENYRMVAFKDMSNEDIFLTKSTAKANETAPGNDLKGPFHPSSWQIPGCFDNGS